MFRAFTVEDVDALDQTEGYRKRPHLHLGNTSIETNVRFVWDLETGFFRLKESETSHANLQTFREVFINAVDNLRRADPDDKNDLITVIFEETDTIPVITVENGGFPIPLGIHPKVQRPVPEVLFGSFFSGTNFRDDEKVNAVGGANGLGSSMTNLFSEFFQVDVYNDIEKKHYKQRFIDFEPKEYGEETFKIKPWDGIAKVSIKYQLKETFGSPDLDLYALDVISASTTFCKRINFIYYRLDGAVKEYHFANRQFKDWLEYYPRIELEKVEVEEIEVLEAMEGRKEKHRRVKKKVITEKTEEYLGPPTPEVIASWTMPEGHEIIVCDIHRDFQCPKINGFINSLPCHQGIHIRSAKDAFYNYFKKIIEADSELGPKLSKVKPDNFPTLIKDNVLFLIKVEISSGTPAFLSQVKDHFTGLIGVKDFKLDLKPGENVKLNKEWKKTRLVQILHNYWKEESEKKMKESDGKKGKISLKKYFPANRAGTRESPNCSLYVSEGKSASEYIKKLISFTPNGKDYMGLFTLRGKIINVMKNNLEDIAENKEIIGIKKILGLKEKTDYTIVENLNELNYGAFVIGVDQDEDSNHIRALLIALFEERYPSLLKVGFVKTYFTPVVRLNFGGQNKLFYRFLSYQKWLEEDPARRKIKARQLKGLASSSDADIKEDFKINKIITYSRNEESEAMIRLAMDDETENKARKNWIRSSEPLDDDIGEDQPISDFVRGDLLIFFHYTLPRGIPAIEDNLKYSTRKIIWGLRKSNNFKKVVSLSGQIIDTQGYHHGDKSLSDAITHLCQDFAGTNNVCLMEGLGQFGSRAGGPSDFGSARYVQAKISPVFQKLFPPADYPLYRIKEEEGIKIEPERMYPVIPMSLVNGASGISTGFSTFIPNYDVKAVIGNIRRLINKKSLMKMIPYYRNYTGRIILNPTGFFSEGKLIDNGIRIQITELPLFVWTETYYEFLQELASEKKVIRELTDHSKATTVDFSFKLTKNAIPDDIDENDRHQFLMELFKLRGCHSFQNMVLLKDNKPKEYTNVDDILTDFYELRLKIYYQRREYQIEDLENEINEKEKFYRVMKSLQSNDPRDEKVVKRIANETELEKEEVEEILGKITARELRNGVDKLENNLNEMRKKLDEIINITPEELWLRDLESLENNL